MSDRIRLDESWKKLLHGEFDKPYFNQLTEFVRQEYQQKTVYPPAGSIFKAFDLCPADQVKVVILGQDPYHGPGQANGLAFSVNDQVPTPPSLVNIYKEIEADLGKKIPPSGNLERWAKQGVLLLNATLTVRAHQAASHQQQGWENFTDAAVEAISQQRQNLVFMLWGASAQKKGAVIDPEQHLVLSAPHPSPLSAHRGFLGCRHFSQANIYLMLNGQEPIDW
jgi:uracil-DNA glycosylase